MAAIAEIALNDETFAIDLVMIATASKLDPLWLAYSEFQLKQAQVLFRYSMSNKV